MGSSREPESDEESDDAPDVERVELRRRSYLGLAAGAVSFAGLSELTGDSDPAGTVVSVDPVYGYGGKPVQPSAGAATLATEVTEAEPNDTKAEAMPISLDTTVAGDLEADSTDWYAFDASSGLSLKVEFTKDAADGVVLLALYRSDGSLVEQRHVATADTIRLAWTTAADTYFLQVVDVEAGSGPYSLSVLSPDGSTETATATSTATPTETATPTPTPTTVEDDFGEQGYGEYGYGGA